MSLQSDLGSQSTQRFIKNNFSPQIIIPELASAIGLEENIILMQVHYWLQRSSNVIDGKTWVYNTFEQWQQQFPYWSLSKIKRIFSSLHNIGLLISQKKQRHSGCHTKWYSIDYERFYSLLEKIKPIEKKLSSDLQSSVHIKPMDKQMISDCNHDLMLQQSDNDLEDIISDTPYTNIITGIMQNIKKSGEEVKNFALYGNGLSLVQIEPIITETTLPDIKKCMSNEVYEQKKLWLQTLEKTRQTVNFSQEDLEITNRMMEIWSKIFIHDKKKVNLYSKRRAKLLKVWHKNFRGNLENWREFCLSVNSSKFLMGEKKRGFKAHFDWIIEEETIEKIREGEFDIGDRIPDIKQLAIEEERTEKERIAQSKLMEMREERRRKEQEDDIKRLATRLEGEALAEIEGSWTLEQERGAKEEFEQYLKGDDDVYDLQHCRGIFAEERWSHPLINIAFTLFKRKRYLKKSYEDFLREAREEYNKQLSTEIITMCNNKEITFYNYYN